MTDFLINCKYLENMRKVVGKFPEYSDRSCNIIINKTFSFKLPTIIAASFSSNIASTIVNDPTVNEFNFSVPTNSSESLNKIKSVLCDQASVTINNDDDINSFAEFGIAIDNDEFINPLNAKLEKDSSEINKENVVRILKSKKVFKIKEMKKETDFIAEHFKEMSQREDFVGFSSDASNASIVDDIIGSNKLSIESEDMLLSFLMTINKSNSLENISTELFNRVFIEYCSPEKCEEFLSFVCNLIQQKNIKSLVSCIGRRFIQKNIPMSPNFIEGRHKYGVLIDDSDPLSGILRREHEKGNVLLEASSIGGGIGGLYSIIEGSEATNFHTNDVANSFISASLKDGKTFILKSYMIRGNKFGDNSCQPKNWKFEGQKASDGQWILLDSHNEDPIKKLQIRKFNVSCKEKLKSVRFTQTGLSTGNDNVIQINAFDIFGVLI